VSDLKVELRGVHVVHGQLEDLVLPHGVEEFIMTGVAALWDLRRYTTTRGSDLPRVSMFFSPLRLHHRHHHRPRELELQVAAKRRREERKRT